MFYDIYCDLCKQNGKTPSGVAKDIGFNRATVTTWKNTGNAPKGELLLKIANYFGVTIDYLLGSEKDIKNTPVLTKKDERDIARDLEKMRQSLESGEALMFDGNPMSPEARESILAAMKLGLEAAKVMNKATYTPKKYRKD